MALIFKQGGYDGNAWLDQFLLLYWSEEGDDGLDNCEFDGWRGLLIAVLCSFFHVLEEDVCCLAFAEFGCEIWEFDNRNRPNFRLLIFKQFLEELNDLFFH